MVHLNRFVSLSVLGAYLLALSPAIASAHGFGFGGGFFGGQSDLTPEEHLQNMLDRCDTTTDPDACKTHTQERYDAMEQQKADFAAVCGERPEEMTGEYLLCSYNYRKAKMEEARAKVEEVCGNPEEQDRQTFHTCLMENKDELGRLGRHGFGHGFGGHHRGFGF